VIAQGGKVGHWTAAVLGYHEGIARRPTHLFIRAASIQEKAK